MIVRPCLDCHRLIATGSRCRPCANARQRAYDASRGGPAARGYGHAWRKVRAQILARDRYRCAYCGGPAGSVDHVLSKVDGGSDDPSNLVASCKSCNTAQENRRRAARAPVRRW
jgi:5-methylcytosine-specific restriction endonuclease McrA